MTPKPLMTPRERRLAGIHRRAVRALRGTDEAAKAQARIDRAQARAGLADFWARMSRWAKENPDD